MKKLALIFFVPLIVLELFGIIYDSLDPKLPITKAEASTKFIPIDTLSEMQHYVYDIEHSISIESYWVSDAHRTEGRTIYFNYKNISSLTIDKLVFTVSFYDNNGCFTYCNIKDSYKVTCIDDGPILPNTKGGGYWDHVLYNKNACHMSIDEINIYYTNNVKLRIRGEYLNLINGYQNGELI